MNIIYHIATNDAWKKAQETGNYEHPSLKEEGFIHCSLDHQVEGVLDRYFKGQTGLVKLVIDTTKLTSKYVYDWSKSNTDTYPHVYGPINNDAIVEVVPVS